MERYKKCSIVSLLLKVAEEKNPFKISFFSSRKLIAFYILHLLNKKDFYGQELMLKIQEDSKGMWIANPGFVYPVLKRLRREGLIEGAWSKDSPHPRLIYSMTEKGKSEYKEVYSVLKGKYDEFLEKLEMLKKEVFSNERNSK
jgi:DNA-binding PadR family transcriptional regulator